MNDADRTLIEATRTHRGRMGSALTFGQDGRNRSLNTNSSRFIGSLVLATVIGVGCVGYSLVHHLLTERSRSDSLTAYQQALASNPLRPTPPATADPLTGYIVDPETGSIVDPKTGYEVDPETGWEETPTGRLVDPRTGWYVDPKTGYRTNPSTGVTIDPETMRVVDK